MTSACFSRGHTGFSRNATLVATVNPPALAGGVFNYSFVLSISIFLFVYTVAYMDRALQDETIATIASSVEKKLKM